MPALFLCLGLAVGAGGLAAAFAFAALYAASVPAPAMVAAAVAPAIFLPVLFTRVAYSFLPRPLPDAVKELRLMVFWAIAVAVASGMAGWCIVLEEGVSLRLTCCGWTLALFSLFAAGGAFYGLVKPVLFTPVIYCALFFVWLMVPVAGMEAYLYAEGHTQETAYAAANWKWTYVFCVVNAIAGIRLLILRQDILRKKNPPAPSFS